MDENVVLDLSMTNEHDSASYDSRINRNLSRKFSQRISNPMCVSVAGEAIAGAPLQEVSIENQESVKEGEAQQQQQQHQHKITITTANISSVEGKGIGLGIKRCHRRPFWYPSPHRVLFFFATLSSMGTVVLLLMTILMGEAGVEGDKGKK